MKYAIIHNDTVKEVSAPNEAMLKLAYPDILKFKQVPDTWSPKDKTDARFYDGDFELKPLSQQVEEGLISLSDGQEIRDNEVHTLTEAEKWLNNPTDTDTLSLDFQGGPVVQPLSLEEQYLDGLPVEEALNEQIRQQRQQRYTNEINPMQAYHIAEFYMGRITEEELKAELEKLELARQQIREDLPYAQE